MEFILRCFIKANVKGFDLKWRHYKMFRKLLKKKKLEMLLIIYTNKSISHLKLVLNKGGGVLLLNGQILFDM